MTYPTIREDLSRYPDEVTPVDEDTLVSEFSCYPEQAVRDMVATKTGALELYLWGDMTLHTDEEGLPPLE